jgi:hypothetical protein
VIKRSERDHYRRRDQAGRLALGWVRAWIGNALLWSVDANKGDGKRFIAQAEELAVAVLRDYARRESWQKAEAALAGPSLSILTEK